MPSGLFSRLYGFDNANPLSAGNPLPVMIGNSGIKNAAITSYCVTTPYFTPYATPTDILTIGGLAATPVRINRILISSTQTTAGLNTWYLIYRTTANTGGSVTAQTSFKLDTTGTATAPTVNLYTAIPTGLGTAAGTVTAAQILSPQTTSVAPGTYILYDDSYAGGACPIVLRTGNTSFLAINFGGAAVPAGLSVSISIFYSQNA